MRSIHFLSLVTALLTNCSGNDDTPRSVEAPAGAVANLAEAPQPSRARSEPIYAVPVDGMPIIGPSDALVTLVEFTDYDCPYCAKAEPRIAALRQKYGADLRIAVAEHPLPMHPHARDAALAALAAAGTGAFEALHAKLFAAPESRSSEALAALAVSSGLDATTFAKMRDHETTRASLATAETLAATLHLSGAPMFFVNGRKISGAQSLEVFDGAIARALAEARELVASGVARDRVYETLLADARRHPAPMETEEHATPGALVARARGIGGAALAGRADAATTIVVFSDFECPYCRRLDTQLRELTQRRPDVRVVLRQRPLAMHEHARLAAKAAIAADLQGKHEAFSRELFAHQDALDRATVTASARLAGLDLARFDRDLESDEVQSRLLADEALANELKVTGTPTSFVDGRRIDGAQPLATFDATIARTLADPKQ